MKNRFQIKSFITATFFLVAYLNVFATQASCNLPHFFEEISKSTQYQNASHSHGHHHNHDDKKSPSHHNHEDSSHHEEDAEKDNNCCNDKTAAFFASQGNPIVSSEDFKNTFCTELVFINTATVYYSPIFYNKGAASYSLPPPKMPDIRVFIQSFII